ncbi:MAG: hypothetical protein PSV16_14275 [Flavobacterium sp.]|nr:hypothetical protein [Flavobacterium sp.]
MKKLIYLFSFAAVLASCAGSDDANENTNPETMLVKKRVFNDGFETVTTNYTYNGQKLVKTTDDNGMYSKLTYTGDLITKWEWFDADDTSTEVETFEYNASGQLTKYTDLYYDFEEEVEVYNYVHNADGSISYTHYSGNSTVQSFDHDGVITATQYSEHHEDLGETYTNTFTFDDKNNPYKNVIGFDKIVFSEGSDPAPLNFNNNVLSNIHSEYDDESGTFTYTYNAANFPLTQDELEADEHYTTTYTYQ